MFSLFETTGCEMSVWTIWLIFFCITNCSAISSVVEEFSVDSSSVLSQESQQQEEPAVTNITPDPTLQEEIEQVLQEYYHSLERKRKTRDDTFGLAMDEIHQGKWKRRRTFKPVFLKQIPRRRAFSVGEGSAIKKKSGFPAAAAAVAATVSVTRPALVVRRSSSLGSLEFSSSSFLTEKEPTSSQLVHMKPLDHEQVHEDEAHRRVVRRFESKFHEKKHEIKNFLIENFRKAFRNAVDEMITSAFSFVTYAAIIFVVRQYSELAVGVSLDLGAFSIEI